MKGPFLGLRAVVPEMQKRGGGSIIITSSIMGVKGGASVAPYATSKHAVIGLMRSASREFASAKYPRKHRESSAGKYTHDALARRRYASR